MQKYLNLTQLPDGNLEVALTEDGRAKLSELVRKEREYVMTWLDLLEYNTTNENYEFVMPDKVSALTEAPIIGFDVTFDEDGDIEEHDATKYWYFDTYMVENEFESLLQNGKIIFTSAE